MVPAMKKSIVPFDCIIVGGGPAGITAAIYLARKSMDIMVITLDIGGQANLSTDVENYTGFTLIHGTDLVKRFEEHLKAFKIKVENEKVTAIEKKKNLFKITAGDDVYWAKSVIVASGKRWRTLKVPGEDRLIGKGIFYSTLFNAPFFKGKAVVVVGGGNSAVQAINELLKFTKEIYVIDIAKELIGDEIMKERIKKNQCVKIFSNCKVSEITGKDAVQAIKFANVKTGENFEKAVKGVVVLIGLEPSLDFKLPRGVKLTARKEIDVDQNCLTKVPGLFAAGDVADVKWKQIIVAAGEGAKAALSAYDYLMNKKEFLEE
jgi:alkyl hydroperoxide reductase subunit F